MSRDNRCCTECSRLASGGLKKFPAFHFTFVVADKVVQESVSDLGMTVRELESDVGPIEFVVSAGLNRWFAITPKMRLILCTGADIQDENLRKDLSIYSGKTLQGRDFLILRDSKSDLSEWDFDIPVISEDQVVMHVHHKYYILNQLPWEYEDEALVTLCNWCHWKLHEQAIVPCYKREDGKLHAFNLTACSRCCGTGVLPEFAHVQDGVCFRCRGSRFEEFNRSSADFTSILSALRAQRKE